VRRREEVASSVRRTRLRAFGLLPRVGGPGHRAVYSDRDRLIDRFWSETSDRPEGHHLPQRARTLWRLALAATIGDAYDAGHRFAAVFGSGEAWSRWHGNDPAGLFATRLPAGEVFHVYRVEIPPDPPCNL
jgi:hypothetical protein